MDMTPKPLAEGGTPAIHVSIATAMMGQKLGSWLMADNPEPERSRWGWRQSGSRGVRLRRPRRLRRFFQRRRRREKPTDIEEAIFAFQKAPDQISRPTKGGATGAKIRLVDVRREQTAPSLSNLTGKRSPSTSRRAWGKMCRSRDSLHTLHKELLAGLPDKGRPAGDTQPGTGESRGICPVARPWRSGSRGCRARPWWRARDGRGPAGDDPGSGGE